MKKLFAYVLLISASVFAQSSNEYNTRYYFAKTFAVGVTDTLYFSFPPLGGKWNVYDSTTGFNFTTKTLADDSRWTGAAALGVHLLSGNTGDSAKVAVGSISKGSAAIGIDENSVTYLVGDASTFSNDVLDGAFHVYTITQVLDPSAAIAIIFTAGDLAGGNRRIEFELRYRR